MVESQASAENNQFTTGSLSAESIANHSEVKVSSAGGGLSTDPTQNIANGFAAGLSALGNIHQQDSSITHSAIGSNINLLPNKVRYRLPYPAIPQPRMNAYRKRIWRK